MGKIKVENFVRSYQVNSKTTGNTLEEFVRKHITTKYISTLQKDVYCTSIVETTCYVKDGEKRFVKFNSLARYICFVMRLIELYTDIEINQDDIIGDYDALNKVGAINSIISAIPETEYAEFSTMLNMKVDDLRDNEYSVTAMLYDFKNSLAISEEVINAALKKLEELIDE
jgi:hypothetical protein